MTPSSSSREHDATKEGHRYVYAGDKFTDPRLIGMFCSPVLRADGKCVVGRKPRNQLVRFSDGTRVVVLGRRLRLVNKIRMTPSSRERDATNSKRPISG